MEGDSVHSFRSSEMYDLICMSNNPTMPEVIFPDVTDVIMPGNTTSTALPHADQLDLAGQVYDPMHITKVGRGRTAVDRFPAFLTVWNRVKTKSKRTAGISIHSPSCCRGLLNSIA